MNFWHTANLAFSDEDREAFNKWKLEIYLTAEKISDESHSLPNEKTLSNISRRARELEKIVCAIPAMFGKVPNA